MLTLTNRIEDAPVLIAPQHIVAVIPRRNFIDGECGSRILTVPGDIYDVEEPFETIARMLAEEN